MFKVFGSVFFALLVAAFSSADEKPRHLYWTTLNYRIVTGDPRGSVEAGTQRVLWKDHNTDSRGFGVPRISGGGEQRKTPGPAASEAPTGLMHGLLVEMTTFASDDRQVRAELRIDWCEPHEAASDDFIATHGVARRLSGTFQVNKNYRIDLGTRDGVATWAEFNFETQRYKDAENLGLSGKQILSDTLNPKRKLGR